VPARLSFREARSFFRQVEATLACGENPQLVFDMSLVEQMDSAAVEMLLECMTECIKHGGDLKLASLSSRSAIVLELTRTDRVFEIYETSSDAVTSFDHFVPNSGGRQERLAA
jgi:anti-anti-sigma factor